MDRDGDQLRPFREHAGHEAAQDDHAGEQHGQGDHLAQLCIREGVLIPLVFLLGENPLVGPNPDDLGVRFPDMSAAYDRELQALAQQVALDMKYPLRRGVYVAVTGPSLETRAEYRMLRALGADVVGMSTVPEVIAARHMGMRVLGLSIITDECLPDALEVAEIDKIIAMAGKAEPYLTRLVVGVLERL